MPDGHKRVAMAYLHEGERGDLTDAVGEGLALGVLDEIIDAAHALDFVEEDRRLKGRQRANIPGIVKAGDEEGVAEGGGVLDDHGHARVPGAR